MYYRKALSQFCGLPTAQISDAPRPGAPKQRPLPLHTRCGIALDALIAHTDLGTRLTSIIALFFGLCSIAVASYAVWVYCLLQRIQPGWLSIMLYLSFAFFGLFLILTLITRYLAALLRISENKRSYTFEAVKRISNR